MWVVVEDKNGECCSTKIVTAKKKISHCPCTLDLGPSDVLKTINTNRSESTITLFCCSHYCSTFAHNFSCNRVNGL